MRPIDVAYAFVEAINRGDVEELSGLMADNHTFVDSDGTPHTERDAVRQGWREYFSTVPDYRIVVEQAFAKGNTVALFGVAEGTFEESGSLEPHNHWKVPAAWRVVVEGKRVRIWQLYVNPEPMTETWERIRK
jgi:ketosteroid isomerase-like protein